MAEKISDLSGAAREARIAELKRKMLEASKRARAAHTGEEGQAAAAVAPVATTRPAPKAAVAAAVAEAKPVAKPARDVPPVGGNGAAAPKIAPLPKRVAPPLPARIHAEPTAELSPAEMTRREFLTYTWAGALGLLLLESGVISYLFLYPRFKAGEFGGKFDAGAESALPDAKAAPEAFPTGKFWLVRTQEGDAKALYMVCPHLGCLYKWVPSNIRFECPCHGSKYTHDGYYIEGPAPRSLDSFLLSVEDGVIVVDTGKKTLGDPSSQSPARAVPA